MLKFIKNFKATVSSPLIKTVVNGTSLYLNQLTEITPVRTFVSPIHAWMESFETGKKVALIELSKDVFGQRIRNDILYRVLRYEKSWREAGTESTKALGQVRGTTRKVFPQKGRGKARVGTIRAPHFRGGNAI
jgi:large subunit ribosomal protein L4